MADKSPPFASPSRTLELVLPRRMDVQRGHYFYGAAHADGDFISRVLNDCPL